MSYMHIQNLYHRYGQDILLFKEAYALEKIHGTSASIKWSESHLTFFSGGEKYEKFVALFDAEALKTKLTEVGAGKKIEIFGEAYGGKQQGMSHTYGASLKFIAFEVRINECWLDVPGAESFVKALGLEFVHYVKASTDIKALDAERDAPSVQAVRNGITEPKIREGVVLRPLIEVTKNNGSRIMCKHKRDEFRETKSPRAVEDPEKLKVLEAADKIADEYVTHQRLLHVLDKIPGHSIEKMRDIIAAMVEDVEREGASEIVPSEAVRKAVGKKTAVDYMALLKSLIGSV